MTSKRPWPEERQWARLHIEDPEAALAALERLVQRMDREGDFWDRLSARHSILLQHCHQGDRLRAFAAVDDIEQLEASHPEEPTASPWVAHHLITYLGDYERSASYIRNALEAGRFDEDCAIWIKSHQLAIQAGTGADYATIRQTLIELDEAVTVRFAYAEIVLPAIEKLMEVEEHHNLLTSLLLALWSESAMQYRFWSLGDPKTLQRIEALLERLGSPVRNRFDTIAAQP